MIAEGEEFERNEVMVMSEKVRQLQSIYKSVEEAGSHAFLNEIRALNASLINKWEEFENSLATHMSNLDLSLKFQETLFEVINSCCFSCGDNPVIIPLINPPRLVTGVRRVSRSSTLWRRREMCVTDRRRWLLLSLNSLSSSTPQGQSKWTE